MPRLLCFVFLLGAAVSAYSQAPASAPGNAAPEGTPRSWAQGAADNEIGIISSAGNFPLRYRVRKVDAKGDTTREVIESRDGGVARLVERDGKPITAAEDAAERDRLNAAIASPEDFRRHHKREDQSRDYSIQLVRLMPAAMIYSYTPGQPQPAGATSSQVVLDFRPDPAFQPPSLIANMLTGLEGRAWVDARSRRLTRVEGRVVRPVNFGWGILARIYPGGTVVFEQTQASGGRWVYSHLEEHITVRELMVKTVPQNAVMTSGNFQPMASLPSYQDAIRMLLAMPLTLR